MKVRYFILLIIASILFTSLSSCQKRDVFEEKAIKGVLDLTQVDLKTTPSFKLIGEWEFYWNHLLEPENQLFSAGRKSYFSLPGRWGKHTYNNALLPDHGFATYRLKVKLPESSDKLSLRISRVISAFRLYVNGQLIGERGNVGSSKETSQPEWLPLTITIPEVSQEIEIILQVSNFFSIRGGNIDTIYLGTSQNIQRSQYQSLTADIFLFGSIFIIALYHFGLFILRPNEKSALYFGLACLILAVRCCMSSERFLFNIIDYWGTSTVLKINVLTVYLLPITFLRYFNSFLPEEFPLNRVRYLDGVCFALLAITLFSPPMIYMKVFSFFEIFVFIIFLFVVYGIYNAIRHKQKGIYLITAGCLSIILTAINDILHDSGIIHTHSNLTALGIFIFVLLQSYLISKTFSEAFIHSKMLSEELGHLNKTLEKRVEERTIELTNANINLKLEVEGHKKTALELIEAKHKAEELSQAKTDFLHQISHEIRSPMNAIIGLSSLGQTVLKKRQLEKIGEYFTIIETSGKRLVKMISDLLDMAKMDAKKIEFSFAPFNFDQTINQMISESYSLSAEKQLSIQFTPEINPINITGDEKRLTQVIVNLFSNAIKFSPTAGTIQIEAQVKGKVLVFSILDSGSGIPENELGSIFEKFVQSSSNRKNTGGTGLGLSICKEIIEGHKGSIWAENRRDQGAIFTFEIPVEHEC